MKPTPPTQPDLAPLLAFGAHPDDIEFGCGGVVLKETRAGRPAHLAVCSHGEAATHGTPDQRTAESHRAAEFLGATVQFLEFDGDAHLRPRPEHAIRIAALIRSLRPAILLAPSLVENQHPDHPKLGALVRDAARIARYGGVRELRDLPPHSVGQLFYYAVSTDAEPPDLARVLIDISDPDILTGWTAAMEAHGSQVSARKYVELQLTRARLHGIHAGVSHAIALFPNDPLVFSSLTQIAHGARAF
jgi:LmbE family N-acetylglucosaminyl deacetylase